MFQNAFFDHNVTPAVRILIIANVAIYIAQTVFDLLTGNVFTMFFGLSRYMFFHGYLWQIFTYAFLHGGIIHLLLNMLGLFFMGPPTEERLGTKSFSIMYCLSAVLGGVAWLFLGSRGLCIGASGAVFGVIGAYAILYPYERLTMLLFFIIPVSMPAWALATGLATIDLLFYITQPLANVAYIAHLGGMATGVAYAWVSNKRPNWWRKWRFFRCRPRLQILPGGESAPTAEEVDRILEKIASQGVASLSRSERETLTRASQREKGNPRRY